MLTLRKTLTCAVFGFLVSGCVVEQVSPQVLVPESNNESEVSAVEEDESALELQTSADEEKTTRTCVDVGSGLDRIESLARVGDPESCTVAEEEAKWCTTDIAKKSVVFDFKSEPIESDNKGLTLTVDISCKANKVTVAGKKSIFEKDMDCVAGENKDKNLVVRCSSKVAPMTISYKAQISDEKTVSEDFHFVN